MLFDLALAALLRGTRRRVVVSAWMITLLGYGSALFLTRTTVTASDSSIGAVPWPGVSTALLGFGLITATVVGAEGARERIAGAAVGWRPPGSVRVTAAAVLAPVAAGAWWLVRGADNPISRVSAGLPQYLAAEDESAAQERTLTLTAGANGTVAYTVARGSGPIIGDADIHLTAAQTKKLNSLVGQLLSGSGGNAAQGLASLDIGYVWAASSVPVAITHALGSTAGLTADTLTGSTGASTAYWQVNGAVGRVTLQNAKGAAIALQYACTGSSSNPGTAPQGSAAVCSQDISAQVNVPAGGSGRVLVLAEQADGGWTAKENGQKLPTTTLASGLQAWTVPSGAGTITVGYQSYTHTIWLIGEAIAFAAATIMALPFGRRPEDNGDEEDEYAEAAAESAEEPGGGGQGRRGAGRDGAAGAGLGAEPPAPEPLEPEPQPVPMMPVQAQAPETETYTAPAYEQPVYEEATAYQAPVYESAQAVNADLYQPQAEAEYGSGAYQQQGYEAYPQQQGYEQSGAYEQQQYAADPYAAQQQYPQEQYPQQGYDQAGYGYPEQQQGYEAYPQQQYAADPYAAQEQYPQQQYPQEQQYEEQQQYPQEQQQYPPQDNAAEQYPEFEQYPGYGQQEQYGQEGWGR